MADVTVMGAGAFGLSVAWACVKRGASVRVIDPNGVGARSSGGVVGALAPHVPENWNDKKEFQFQSLIMAEAWWAEVAAAGGKSPGYGRTGRLQPVMEDRALRLARAREASAAELWRGEAQWQVVSSEDIGGWAPNSSTGYLIHDSLSARMHPRMACAALAAAVVARGGEIVSEGAAAGKVVWATGWHGLDCGKSFDQAALLAYDAGPDAPQLFADTVHIVPHVDGTVAIGSTSEREFDDPTSVDGQIDVVIEKAFAAIPALARATVLERWAGVRPRAKSRAPMLGEHPLRDGDFIANGGFKIGFGMGPKVGEVMADLVLDGVDTVPEGFKSEASL